KDRFYDWILYLMLPLQWFFIFYFLTIISKSENTVDLIGRINSMGLMCGIIGINAGHELGHRMKSWERLIGEALLFTSLENHFLPYHNRGHHTNVGTPSDAATARKNEPLYIFWFRSQIGSYIQAWQIENTRMLIMKKPWFHSSNKMIQYSILYIFWLTAVLGFFGTNVFFYYIGACATGIILLESVNYIEHYGLMRKQRENGTYETVKLWHSWNSNHIIGRVVLFELSRHSDHHFKADKPYQILDSFEQSPIMPTGYPGMIILSLIPPLFFKVMNKPVENALSKSH
ncbi:MAG: alkane 1-monooxygenase, partial [Crocinitomicaceae bacterium]